MLETLSGLPIKNILYEAIWREVNYTEPLMIQFMEKDTGCSACERGLADRRASGNYKCCKPA